MRVRVERFGGFHAPAMGAAFELSTKDLSESDQARLEKLAAQVQQDPPPTDAPSKPDMFGYELTIEDETGDAHTFEATDETMTPAFRELVNWLRLRD